MRTVLVGYGHAARNLHLAAIAESDLRNVVEDVIAVDPKCPVDPDVKVYQALTDVPAVSDSDMFHVTVPPADHAAVVEGIIEIGGKRLIVEKPLAADGHSARRIVKACAEAGASLYPVGIWNHSAGMRRLRQDLETQDRPLHYEFEQSKNRIDRTLLNSSHHSAFEVELPHQVLAAVWMFGEIAEVVHAESRPLCSGDRTVPHAGGAYVVVKHRTGLIGTLIGHLDRKARTRRLRVTHTDGELEVRLPRSRDEVSSFYRDSAGRTTEIPDRPLTEFLTAAYAAGPATGPNWFDVDLHLHCTDVLDAARRKAGVP